VGIASLVVQMNVPAVVAMQYQVSNITAQRFALEFYRRLAGNEPVDKAVQEARRHIALGPAGFKSRDFATPVLFMRDQQGRLFQRPEVQITGVQADKTLIMRLQEKLYDKCDELDERTYFDVGKRLKTMREKGIDDQGKERIQLLREFLDEKLTTEKFIERWGTGTAAQDREKSPDYQILAALLKRGELIPFLGPGVLPLSGFPDPSSPDLVKKMAQRVHCSKFKGTLPMISQYCKSEKKHSKGIVIDRLKELLLEEKDSNLTGLLYEMLAGIEVPILVVSTSYDDLLEFSFCQKRKKFAVVSHHVQAAPGSDFGKLRVQYSDKTGPDRLYKAEEISELKLLDDEYSIIYKICGRMNLVHDNNRPARELPKPEDAPPMIFEEEFFIFSKYLEQSIPDFFIRKFSDSGFLFLGYNLDDWQDRLIAYVILEKWKNGNNSFTVCKEPDPYERTFWKSLLSTELYGVDLEEFIEQLHERMNTQGNRT
ncbi:MAG: SIR2 family protein, partial [Candidatus Aminicenantes bacterium]